MPSSAYGSYSSKSPNSASSLSLDVKSPTKPAPTAVLSPGSLAENSPSESSSSWSNSSWISSNKTPSIMSKTGKSSISNNNANNSNNDKNSKPVAPVAFEACKKLISELVYRVSGDGVKFCVNCQRPVHLHKQKHDLTDKLGLFLDELADKVQKVIDDRAAKKNPSDKKMEWDDQNDFSDSLPQEQPTSSPTSAESNTSTKTGDKSFRAKYTIDDEDESKSAEEEKSDSKHDKQSSIPQVKAPKESISGFGSEPVKLPFWKRNSDSAKSSPQVSPRKVETKSTEVESSKKETSAFGNWIAKLKENKSTPSATNDKKTPVKLNPDCPVSPPPSWFANSRKDYEKDMQNEENEEDGYIATGGLLTNDIDD